jgi:hypothetical protein
VLDASPPHGRWNYCGRAYSWGKKSQFSSSTLWSFCQFAFRRRGRRVAVRLQPAKQRQHSAKRVDARRPLFDQQFAFSDVVMPGGMNGRQLADEAAITIRSQHGGIDHERVLGGQHW